MQKKRSLIFVLILLGGTLIYKYGIDKSDNDPPMIIATVPECYEQNVPVDIKSIKFIFNEKMEDSFSTGRIGKELPVGIATWEDTDRTVLNIPINGPLPYQTSYTFVLNPDDTLQALTGKSVSAPMKDVKGNELPSYFFSFRTQWDPASEEVMNKLAFNELDDADKDGLENELELKIGTNPHQIDTDADGLADYDEYCKYRTDATRADSDGDGKIDSDWHERREYTYTIRAVCEINDPVDLESMNDLFQDVKIIAKRTPMSHTRYEILLYPDSKPHLLPTRFPYEQLPAAVERYTQRGFATNFSPKMQTEVQRMISECHNDLKVIERVQFEMAQMQLVYEGAAFLYSRVDEENQLVMTRDPLEGLKPESLKEFQTVEQLLKGIFYGDSMFKARQHGVCDSRATLRATMLKASGIPTKLTLAIPLIYCYDGEKEELIQNLKRERFRSGGYVVLKPKSQGHGVIVNHSYVEVYVNNKWIRVDRNLNEGPVFNNNQIYLKIISFADWGDVDFTHSWSHEQWFTHRPYKTVELSDADPKYTSVYSDTSSHSVP